MWSALKADLGEFVATVKDESATVLTPQQQREADEDSQFSREQQENEHGIIMGEDGEVIYEDDDGGAMMEEIDRLVREEETFTEPLDAQDEEVMAFLKDFDVEQKTNDISKLLKEYPETLQVQFEYLVPTQISYKEFWERYYFRCDEERIQRHWEEEQEALRKAREEAIANTVRGVKNLFGGAVKAVSSTLQAADDGVDAVTASPFESTPPPSGTGGGLFGAVGRPPFVMNTAVDEDDDESEEELGWDDDEDDLDEEEEEEEYEEQESEEITFSGGKSEEIEKLTEQLSQAMEERDQLHNTVEMQVQEISRLKSGDTSGPASKASDDALEKLKMQLFEKDSELAALKASLEDTQDDSKDGASRKDAAKLASQERELEQLREAVGSKDSEITALKEELDGASAQIAQLLAECEAVKSMSGKSDAEVSELKDELDKSSAEVEKLIAERDSVTEAHATAAEEKEELEMQLSTLREQLSASQSEAEMLRQTVETVSSGTESQATFALEEAAAAKAQVDSLTAEVEDLKGNLHFMTGRAEHLERELQEAKDAMKKQEAEFARKLADEVAKVNAEHEQLSSGTQNSESTGVKIAPPTPPKEDAAPATKIERAASEDEDDWGDEWGDEDE
jgi:uncharacterized coiled-coil DUF342 family protein